MRLMFMRVLFLKQQLILKKHGMSVPVCECLPVTAIGNMVGLKPSDVPPPLGVKMASAGAAACIADIVTFPLDTAKVRLQVHCEHELQQLLIYCSALKDTRWCLHYWWSSHVESRELLHLSAATFQFWVQCVTTLRFKERRRQWEASATKGCSGPSAPWSARRGPGLCITAWLLGCRDRCASPPSESASMTMLRISTLVVKTVSGYFSKMNSTFIIFLTGDNHDF